MWDGGETVVLISRGVPSRDSDGNTVYPNPVEVSVDNAVFDPNGTAEQVQGQDQVTDQPIVYLPPGAPVPVAIDAVRVRGDEYEVDGTSATRVSPWTGWAPGTVVKLVGVTG